MGYKSMIELSRKAATAWQGTDAYGQAATLITMLCEATETLLAERDAAVEDLTKICEDNPDVCQYCKHMPCTEKYGRCIGWEWRGPQKGSDHGT